MPVANERDDWILRVLGVRVGVPPRAAADVGAVWRTAREAVDDGLNALARELRDYDDPDLNRIAELGLFGLTNGGAVVPLTRALLDYGAAGPDAQAGAAAALRAATAGMRAQIDGNPRVKMVDDNPFGIPVCLRATLGKALREIEAAIA